MAHIPFNIEASGGGGARQRLSRQKFHPLSEADAQAAKNNQTFLSAPSRIGLYPQRRCCVVRVARGGVVWCGVVWCGVVWCGMVWSGLVWCVVYTYPQTRIRGWTCAGHWWSCGGYGWRWGGHAVDIGGHGVDMRWTLVDMLKTSAGSAHAFTAMPSSWR